MRNVNDKFVELLTDLTPEEFLGLAKFLEVRITTDDFDKETKIATPRDANEILSDILNTYADLSRVDRRELVSMLKHAKRKEK